MKKLLLALVCFLAGLGANAQSLNEPASWTVSVKRGSGTYDIVFDVKLGPNWHVSTLDPGGDGMMIAPSFEFKSGMERLIGKPREVGTVIEEAFEGVDGKVRYFKGKAQFIQTVKARRGSTVKGSYSFQLCNDKMCLPPKTVAFSVKIP